MELCNQPYTGRSYISYGIGILVAKYNRDTSHLIGPFHLKLEREAREGARQYWVTVARL
jgi:hypothetical protein